MQNITKYTLAQGPSLRAAKTKKIKNPANYESQFPRHQHNPALALGEAR